MLRRLRPRSIYDLMAAIACFGVLAGGTAYAADTINSTDIVDGQVKSVDIGNGEVNSADVKDQSLTTFDVSTFLGADIVDGSLTGADVANDSMGPAQVHEESLDFKNTLLSSDIGTAAVGTDEVANNSLTGADINEATLDLSSATAGTFAFGGEVATPDDGSFVKVASKTLPAGAWAIFGTANTYTGSPFGGDVLRSATCELRNGPGSIGSATDRREIPVSESVSRTLSMSGGANIPAGGAEVSLWCQSQSGYDVVHDSQVMMIRIGGFS